MGEVSRSQEIDESSYFEAGSETGSETPEPEVVFRWSLGIHSSRSICLGTLDRSSESRQSIETGCGFKTQRDVVMETVSECSVLVNVKINTLETHPWALRLIPQTPASLRLLSELNGALRRTQK